MATSEEAETQRFYLRKIEGAEILLAFETNFFRQELHKWSPVAPEPPPILEASKSTRKPRPTKLQKLMAQHGVEDPEDLPGWVKGKHAGLPGGGKRKGSEEGGSPGLGGGPAERQRLALAGRPPALIQPAPSSALLDRSDSGTPTSQRFSLSAPGSGHAHGHHGGVGVGPRELLTGGGGPALFSYDHHPLGGIHHTMPPVSSPGAAFTNSHHASPFTRPYSASGSVGGVVSPGSQVQGIFTPGALARHGADPALGQGVRLASPPMRDGFAPHVSGVSIPPIGAFRGPGDLLLGGTLGGTPVKDPNMDKIFDDLTNQDDDEGEVPVATGEVAKTNGDVEDGGVGEKQGVVRTMEGDVDRYAGAPLAFSAEGEDLFRDSDGE
jgi:histone demethylase JARID1